MELKVGFTWSFWAAVLSAGVVAITVNADPAKVESVDMRASGGLWTVSVTLSHGDTGWDDYADGWRVVLEDGTVIGERPLAHPHVNEQPFTRSTSGVAIPEGTETVYIETRTNIDGWAPGRYPVAVE